MKRIILFLCTLFAYIAFATAQQQTESRLSLSAELGMGHLFANSNLSPSGIHYRGEHDNGFSGSVRLSYQLDKLWSVGVKYNFFTTSGNYTLDGGMRVADDVCLHYIAPQVGLKRKLRNRFLLDYALGVGCMHYQNKGLYDKQEQTYTKSFLASNIDMMISYKLYEGFYIGLGASVTGGKASSLKEKAGGVEQTLDLDKWNRIKVVRTDLLLTFKAMM